MKFFITRTASHMFRHHFMGRMTSVRPIDLFIHGAKNRNSFYAKRVGQMKKPAVIATKKI